MSREYEALFNEMEKTPALPAGISAQQTTQHGQRPSETPSLAATMPRVIHYAEEVRMLYSGAYCARSISRDVSERCVFLIIVPARNEAEAAVGSGILAIGGSETEAWFRAYQAL